MRIIKKIDWYLIKTFTGLFLMTFFICVFILLMQFVWMHVKDLVGKGVEVSVLLEFFWYAIMSVVPLALPLAILLASLMTFGNLGEKFELTAMKSAGISLFRIMRPLAFAGALISVGAFFFSNNVLPISQVKLWALIFSLRQKSPEMEIPEGEFYDGIPGYNIYIRDKNHQTGMLYDMMIYDYSEGFNDAKVMVADSGKFYFTADQKYLILSMFSGESFENLEQEQSQGQKRDRIPYRRETFGQKNILIDFSTEFNRYDESILNDQHVSKNVTELMHSIDSVNQLVAERAHEQGFQIVQHRYFGRERFTAFQVPPATEEMHQYRLFEVYENMSRSEKERVYRTAIEKAQSQQDQVEYNAITLDEYAHYVRKHEVELHRKFTLAFACLIFFFIGAPLGAITKKGGLGAPVVISVVMFIIYYIIDNIGYKMAREALWPAWQGMWLSSAVLLPIGIFLTYKAATDSALFNPDAWQKIARQQFAKIKKILRRSRLARYLIKKIKAIPLPKMVLPTKIKQLLNTKKQSL
ncbi:MAG: LptF/LptG family permease [Paludibacteraceae bacterium]|nr:LptF/LptG family permease [Paludibacteraceae bacterium]